jgi:hypothetical protein
MERFKQALPVPQGKEQELEVMTGNWGSSESKLFNQSANAYKSYKQEKKTKDY